MKKIANLISWIFLPLFTPIYGLLVVLYYPVYSKSFWITESLFQMPTVAKLLFLSLFVTFIVLAPGVSFYMMKTNKTISSLAMEKQEERGAPIAIMFVYCLILSLFLWFQAKQFWVPTIIIGMVCGGALASLLAFFINKKIKISLHSIGMGTLFGFLYLFFLRLENIPLFLLFTVIIFGGIVGTARLILKQHTLKEIMLGYLLGFITQIVCIYYYPIINGLL